MPGCVFCGNEANPSGEHVWPDWLRDVVPSAAADMWEVTRTATLPGGEDVKRRFRVAPYTEKVYCVCHDCNTHWMSDIETDTSRHLAPLIRGERTALNAGAQALVATWAALRVAILDQTQPREARSIHDDFYAALYAQGQGGARVPPPSCWVIAAGYENPGEGPPIHQTHSLQLQPVSDSIDRSNPNGYSTTFTIGYLALHVLGFELPVENFAPFKGPKLRGIFECIWPVAGDPLTWPLPTVLGPEAVLSLSNMWD